MKNPALSISFLVVLIFQADFIFACTDEKSARIVALKGSAVINSSTGSSKPQIAWVNQNICEDSKVQVMPNSLLTLALPGDLYIDLSEKTEILLKKLNLDVTTIIKVYRGFLNFISRKPKEVQIENGITNAMPVGTEFAFNADDANAAVWVYEGKVKVYNQHGSLLLKPGNAYARVQKGRAPALQIDIKPEDAVNWALYYPPLMSYPAKTDPIDSTLKTAIEDYRHGRIDLALNRLDSLPPAQQTPYFYQIRAAILLAVGQVKPAEEDIQELLKQDVNDAEGLALKSVIALTQNRKDEALKLAQQAVSANPQSATAFSALSYAEQGSFDLDKAYKAAITASKLAPHDALIWARQAELELSLGMTNESENSAKQAFELDPTLERAQTIRGFAFLQQMEADDAQKAFTQALDRDSSSPLARLGLGLAKIRKGHLEEGRKDIEIAAILDPNNSIIRSYLGKAYYEERRPDQADEQFKLAKQRDQKDPTPYFYDAINKQTTNQPVEALRGMQKAIELNNNRIVYRSKLALDKDAAARTANIARIYNDLGFGRVALKEAWKSLSYDSTNSSAHRFLSDAYIGQPRYRVARASELLQAQLLQPINITPVQPQLTNENIGVLNSTGPGSLSANEYDPLYNRNGAHVVLNGAYGSRNTKTDNAILSGVYNNLSVSFGQFHYQTDGFRDNDDYNQNIYNAFGKYAFTSDLSLQIELKSENVRAGDIPLRLNGFHQGNLRQTIKHDTARVGGHYKIDSEQDIISSFFYTTRKDGIDNHRFIDKPSAIDDYNKTTLINSQNDGYQTELQYLFHPDFFELTAGFGYLNLKAKESFETISKYINRAPPNNIKSRSLEVSPVTHINYFNWYLYSKQYLLSNLTTILGLSFDSYDDETFQLQQLNPKLGLIWNPIKNFTVRSAAFQTLIRPLAANQTIEPTQVAGFNQFFDGNNGAQAWQYAFGVDYNLNESIFFGGEVNWRDTKQPLNGSLQKREELAHLAYLYWTPIDLFSFRAEYRFDKITRQFEIGQADSTFPQNIETHQVPLSLNLFHKSGLFGKITGTYVVQHVGSVVNNEDPAFNSKSPISFQNENFWSFDAVIGYRLPQRYGTISFEARNLFDNNFNYQSNFDASGPQISPFIPERQLFAKISIFY